MGLARRAEQCRERFGLTVSRWPEPQTIFAPVVQRVDEFGERLPRSLAGESAVGMAVLLAAAVLVDSKPPPRPAAPVPAQAASVSR